jgi:hypothetical protein
MIKTGTFYSFFQSHSFLGKRMDGSLGKECWAWVGWVEKKKTKKQMMGWGERNGDYSSLGTVPKSLEWVWWMQARLIEREQAKERERAIIEHLLSLGAHSSLSWCSSSIVVAHCCFMFTLMLFCLFVA